MGDPSDPESAAVFDFLEERREDLEAGRRLPLAHYLARHPAHEEALAREWLRAEGGPSEALPGAEAPPAPDAARVGSYRLQVELGRGGQGTVWRARDERLGRLVALKRIEGGLGSASRERRERFRREAELIARLDHPGLCRVLEVELEGEAPWIAMQHVEGESLATLLERAHAAAPGTRGTALALPVVPRTADELRSVLGYFERAARALHAAHEAGVIHRDVKPGNLMVTPAGEPVVLDFGLARLERAAEGLTLPGEVFGTPAYMSPEQLAGDSLPLDRRTDVYSLGVCLHEALTLRKPFEGPTHLVLAERVRTLPPPDPREMNPRLPPELVTVLAVALEKDRARRYASALELAEDLRRVSAREPIRARPTPYGLRLARWTRRHPVLAVLIALLSISLALSTWQGARERRALRFALGRHLAERSRALLAEDQAAALALGIEAARLAPGHLTSAALFDALEACRIERVLDGGSRLVTALALDARTGLAFAGQEDGRFLVWELASGKARADVRAHEQGLVALVLGGLDERGAATRAWTIGKDQVLREWRLDDGLPREARAVHLERAPLALAIDAAEERCALLLEGGRARVLELAAPERARELEVDPELGALDFFADGSLLLGPGRPERPARALVWRTERPASGANAPTERASALDPLPVGVARLSPTRDEVLLAGSDGGVRFRDSHARATRAEVVLGAPAGAAVWSTDGEQVALAAGGEGAERVHVLALGGPAPRRRLLLDPHGGRRVLALAFSPDGTRLASASSDTTVRVLELESGRELALAKSYFRPEALHWSADGTRLCARYTAPVLQVLFAAERPDVHALAGHELPLTSLAFSPDGGRLLSASADGTARLWSTPADAPGRELARLAAQRGPLAGAAFDAAGHRAVTWGRDGEACVLAGDDLRVLHVLRHDEPLALACFAPGSEDVLTLTASGGLRLWRSGLERWRAAQPAEDALLCLAPDASGSGRAFLGTRRGRILELELESGALRELGALASPVREIALGPRAAELVLACGDGSLRFLDPHTGEELRPALVSFPAERLALSADQRLLLAFGTSGPGAVAALELPGNASLRPSELQRRDSLVCGVLSSDGSLALTLSRDGALLVWEPRTGRPILARELAPFEPSTAAFGPSERGWRIAVGGRDGGIRILPVDPQRAALARKPRELRQWERAREERLALPLRWP